MGKTLKALATLLLFCLIVPILSQQVLAAEITDKVLWIYDGDTLKTKKLGKVRLIGIDSPERENSDRDKYYLRQGIEQSRLRKIAGKALSFNIKKAKGKKVRLRFEAKKKDRHGRHLAYLLLPDGKMLNKLLIEKGLAAVYRRFDFSMKKDFLEAEKGAQKKHRGLWR